MQYMLCDVKKKKRVIQIWIETVIICAYLSILLTMKRADKNVRKKRLIKWQDSQLIESMLPPSLPILGAVPSVVHHTLFDGEQLEKFS